MIDSPARQLVLVVALCFLSLLAGCGKNDGMVAVTGTVSYQGQPLTRGLINFHGGPQPYGAPIDAQGKYAARLPPGTYRVTVAAPAVPPVGWKEGDPLPEMKALVPGRFALPDTAGLEATVSDAIAQVLDFDLHN